MAILLRIMCWNIQAGSRDGRSPANSTLPIIARHIRAKYPDIVLLNDAQNWQPWRNGGINQVVRLSELTDLPYRHWRNTNALGLSGHKAIGVLSRYPLGPATEHPINKTNWKTLETTFTVDNVLHHVFSTRFDWKVEPDNVAAHQESINLVQSVDRNAAVIFGGDFNAKIDAPQYNNFVQNSGLLNAGFEPPDPLIGGQPAIDHIFCRGSYKVTQRERRFAGGDDEPSDHPWVFVELSSPPGGFVCNYGSTIKLKHLLTGGILHSHTFNYGHPGSSGQQQVTAFGKADDNDFWRVKSPHGQPEDYRAGHPVQDGDVIRLEHVTRRNLHSHSGHPSPITGQQEVTCFGEDGLGDGNDNWQIEIDGGGTWESGRRVRLIHLSTKHALHSHADFSHPKWTRGQQEVTAIPDRDDNDWWYLFEGRSVGSPRTMPTGPAAQGDDIQPGEVLTPGQSISSANGQYKFIYQTDGNLVLYRNRDGRPLWASNTNGRPQSVTIMQDDGNLVIYEPGIKPIWSSDTWRHPGSRLIVQDDGNVVIYRTDNTPVWATNTAQPEFWRFQQVNDYASAQGFVSGFPNFHEANHGAGVVRGTLLLRDNVVEWRDVLAAELGNPPRHDVGARFRAVNDWAGTNGYFAAFPNFHEADYGQGTVYGTILLKSGTAEWRDVSAEELGNPPGDDIGARFRATNNWAARNGFAAGFPNFHEADYGQGVVYGTILLKTGMVEWRDVPADVLATP